MKKLIEWCSQHGLGIATLILLVFIPLYPKLPLLDIKNTWVYIRVEDFLVLFVLLFWVMLFAKNKASLKTPLTLPLILFWLVGAVATIHGMLLIFPTISGVFANVALLSFVRRIEYMSVFFIAYSAVKDRASLAPVVVTLAGTTLLVSLYGLGQKYMGLPAYLTMNEEFAKGIPLTLSSLSRVSSTFAGHYDLAAYYVLVLPIMASLIFGYRHPLVRMLLAGIVLIGVVVLFMTVSRISFFALLLSLAIVLFFQSRKTVIMLAPVAVLAGILFLVLSPQLVARFGSTVKPIDVIVDAKTGYPVGHAKEVERQYFDGKQVWQRFYLSIGDLETKASPTASFVIPTELLPQSAVVLTEPSALTGEDLPSGTGYINLTLSPVMKRLGSFYYEPASRDASPSAAVYVINGQYLLKKAFAYDISFTTRFQGEWPNAIAAFKRNVLLGSGYGSASLAVDNSYLRMLAEVGSLGLVSFITIFLMAGVYIRHAWEKIYAPVTRSFVLGFAAGVVGLAVNAVFIDVFEASKVAFVLWLLTGTVMGTVALYSRVPLRFLAEVKRIITSSYAVGVYLLIAVILLFSQMTRNYFVGDDFTWFRWAADCGNAAAAVAERCVPKYADIARYFTDAQGFFYRPGAKLYFLLMYQLAWLNQTTYHAVSLALHYVVSVLVFLIGIKVFGRKLHAAISALLFIGLAGFSEAIFWVSASGFLFASAGMLTSLLLFIMWKEKHRLPYLILASVSAFAAMMFHELGVVTPLLYLLYSRVLDGGSVSLRNFRMRIEHWVLVAPVPLYATLRLLSGSHWFSGDYSYNLFKLPLNAIGNAVGYALVGLTGSFGSPLYQILRSTMRGHVWITAVIGIAVVVMAYRFAPKLKQWFTSNDRAILYFALGFFVVALLPFLGLGNLSPRYGYLASVGLVYLIVFGLSQIHKIVLPSGRDIANGTIALLISVFFMVQIASIQQLHKDWFEAGEKVRRFFISMESHYQDEWASGPVEFHFVSVPIRYRDAWVFPVGLSDALWFVFRNPSARLYTWSDTTEPLKLVAPDSPTQKIFVFDDEGNLREVKKQTTDTP